MSQEGYQLDDMSEPDAELYARLADYVDGHGEEAERAEVERLIRSNRAAAKIADEIREDSVRLREVLGWNLPWHTSEPPQRDPETQEKVEALKGLVAREEGKRVARRRLWIGGMCSAASAAAVIAFLCLVPPATVGEARVLGGPRRFSEARSFVVRAGQPVTTDATSRIEVKLHAGSVVSLFFSSAAVFETDVVWVHRGKFVGTAGPNGLQVGLLEGRISVAPNSAFTLQYVESGAILIRVDADATFSGKGGEWPLSAGKTFRIASDGSVVDDGRNR